MSDIIAADELDKFIERIQLVIAEYIEHRFHQEHEGNQEFYDSEHIVEISRRDLDNHARIVGMRAIETKELATFYQYQALQYLERVLESLPNEYYTAYHSELKEKEASE